MKLLAQLILVSACCWASGAQAQVHCNVVTKDGQTGCTKQPRMQYVSTSNVVAAPLPAQSASWGVSPAAVGAAFPSIIYASYLANSQLNALISGMDNYMIAHLSAELVANDTGGYTAKILALAAQQLTAPQLLRLEAAFGPYYMNAALLNAPAAVQSAYHAIAYFTPFRFSYWYVANYGNPVADISTPYLYELFLEAYSLPGNMGVEPAKHMMVRYVNAKIKLSPLEILVIVASVISIAESKTAAVTAQFLYDISTADNDWSQVVEPPMEISIPPIDSANWPMGLPMGWPENEFKMQN